MMTSRRCVVAVGVLIALASVAAGQGRSDDPFVSVGSGSIALRHVRLVDGTGAPARPDHTVLLDRGRIIAIGPSDSIPVPSDAVVLDLPDHTVLPGFVGLHAHTYYGGLQGAVQMAVTAPLLYLAHGVTTAMTAGTQLPYHEIHMTRAVEAGERPGPRFLIAGPYLDGDPARPFAVRVATPAAVTRAIDYWAAEGATWIKFLGRVRTDVLRAGIEHAHANGLRVSGHLCSVTFTEAAELGIDLLHHGFLMNTDYVEGKPADQCPADYRTAYSTLDLDSPGVRSSVAALAASGAAVASTLAVYESFVPGRAHLAPRTLEMLSPETRRAVEAKHRDPSRWDTRLSPALFEQMMAWERAFVDAGGLLGAGADPWDSGILPGIGNVRQYELLLDAGFPPEESVRIMTLNGARILGLDDETGSLVEGKRADLIVARGNPLTDPTVLYDVITVFRNGVGYDATALREAAKGRVGVD